MKRNALSALIALALVGGSAAVHAQDFGKWYIAPRIGAVFSNSSRTTDTSFWSGISAGAWVNPNLAVDFEYTINNANFKGNSWRNDPSYGYGTSHQWESVGLDVSARWFFGDEGSTFRPYLMGGVGMLRHAAYSGSLLAPYGYHENGWDPMVTLGAGFQYNMNYNLAFRGELAARHDWDENTRGQLSQTLGYDISSRSGYTDAILSVALVYSFGSPPAPPAPPAAPPPPPPADCHTLDDDQDGVNNCDDKCPGTAAGTQVGPDGCPQSLTIDLRGVNFKFDRPKKGEKNIDPTLQVPTADSIAILDQAVDALNRYPDLTIKLDGYTDSIGTDAYNQGLSERRAKIVNEYLLSHGVAASRITGVTGYGETNPVDTNATAAGRARNRRTEIKLDNPPTQ